MKDISGKMDGKNLRIAIVVGRFNDFITRKLLEGAIETLIRYGVHEENISTVWIPGCFEIPLTAKHMASSGNYDSVICLGAVIKGATPHFDYVSGQCASGVMQVGLETGIPTIFGVLTTDTMDQAIERSGVKMGNKGSEAAVTAIEMGNLFVQSRLAK